MRYEIVPEQSFVWIDARSSVHPIHVEVDGLEGHAEVERVGDHIALAAGTRVQVAVDRLESGNPLIDIETKRRISVRRHPHIVGLATIVEDRGAGRSLVVGDLTFHGQTTQVSGEVLITMDGDDDVLIEGSQQFDVRDWGLQPPRLVLLKVEPVVDVRIRVRGRRVR